MQDDVGGYCDLVSLAMSTLDELISDPACDLSDPIELCSRASFRWGNCAAILYDPTKDTFKQPFLWSLYERTRLSGQRHPKPMDLNDRGTLGLLPNLFCGMTNIGPDAILKYLSERAVCVVGEWRAEAINGDPNMLMPAEFRPLGFCFPSTQVTVSPQSLTGVPSNSVFAGYTIFSEAWRTPQQRVLMYLGLAWLFHTFKLAALHGSRYETNHLTKRWTHQFGFRDCGALPYCMMGEPGGPLVSGVFSTCLRGEFEALLRGVLERTRQSANSSESDPI